jgi:hypothetical protein
LRREVLCRVAVVSVVGSVVHTPRSRPRGVSTRRACALVNCHGRCCPPHTPAGRRRAGRGTGARGSRKCHPFPTVPSLLSVCYRAKPETTAAHQAFDLPPSRETGNSPPLALCGQFTGVFLPAESRPNLKRLLNPRNLSSYWVLISGAFGIVQSERRLQLGVNTRIYYAASPPSECEAQHPAGAPRRWHGTRGKSALLPAAATDSPCCAAGLAPHARVVQEAQGGFADHGARP